MDAIFASESCTFILQPDNCWHYNFLVEATESCRYCNYQLHFGCTLVANICSVGNAQHPHSVLEQSETRPTKKLIEFQEGPPTTNHFPLDFLVNLQFVFIELLYSRSYNTTRKSGQTKSLPSQHAEGRN